MSFHALAHSSDSFLTLESSRHSSKSFSPHALKTTHVHREARENSRLQLSIFQNRKGTNKKRKKPLSKIQDRLSIAKLQKY
jgi:hypothetical protein